jgi:hypothetical protein
MSSSWLVNISRSQRFVTYGVKLTSGSSFLCLLYLRAYNIPTASLSLCVSLFLCKLAVYLYVILTTASYSVYVYVCVCVCAENDRILRCNYIYSGINSLMLPKTLQRTCSDGYSPASYRESPVSIPAPSILDSWLTK